MRRLWWLAVAAAMVAALIVGAVGWFTQSGRTPASTTSATRATVDGITLSNAVGSCPTGGFCIQGSVSGVGPISPQTMSLTLVNPNQFPIFVTSLAVAAGNTPTCAGSITLSSPGWSAHDSSPLPTDAIPIAGATSAGPGTSSQNVAVKWTDSRTVDQTSCLNTSIPLTFSGHAIWYGNCITGKQNNVKIAPGQVTCVAPGGSVTGGVNIPKNGGLVLDPGSSVSGGLTSSSGATEIMACNATVSGGVNINLAAGPVVIGNSTYCPGNRISGGLVVTNSSQGAQLVGNDVSGGLTVAGDAGSSVVAANTVTGGFTCTPNNQSLSNSGQPNSVTGKRIGTQCQGGF